MTYKNLGIRLFDGQRSAAGDIVPVGIIIPCIPEDPSDTDFHPGKGWVKNKNGNWKNDAQNSKLHPDPGPHGLIGPHFDWQRTKYPKLRIRIRRRGSIYQFWDKDLGEEGDWAPFNFDVLPLE